MMRQITVSSFAILVLGSLCLGCPAGGVGDPCIPNVEYDPNNPGAVLTGVQVEERSFQCETRVCLVNHFQGRVSCPWGNYKNGLDKDKDPKDAECWLPGTDVKINSAIQVEPQCSDTKDNVYCSCLCGHQNAQGKEAKDSNVKYCECPSGFSCAVVSRPLGEEALRGADEYCVRDSSLKSQPPAECPTNKLCGPVNGDKSKDPCGYGHNRQKF